MEVIIPILICGGILAIISLFECLLDKFYLEKIMKPKEKDTNEPKKAFDFFKKF